MFVVALENTWFDNDDSDDVTHPTLTHPHRPPSPKSGFVISGYLPFYVMPICTAESHSVCSSRVYPVSDLSPAPPASCFFLPVLSGLALSSLIQRHRLTFVHHSCFACSSQLLLTIPQTFTTQTLICMWFFLRCFNILCYASGFYMLLFFRQMFLTIERARVCVCVCVVHWHCTAQLSMFNMEKRYRNKIIIIIINAPFCFLSFSYLSSKPTISVCQATARSDKPTVT